MGMKANQGTATVSDRRTTLLLRAGVAVLVVGTLAFAGIYYQGQHVNAGPSMLDRQTTTAEQAVRETPNDVNARLTLASQYQLSKRYGDALTQYDIILNAVKGNRFALLGQGSVLIAQGNLTAAAASYKEITSQNKTGEFAGADPQLQEAYYYLGSIAVKQSRTQDAIFELRAALAIDPADSDALYFMGLAQVQAGQTQPAIDAFTKALGFVPTGWCEPSAQLALAYGKLGNAPKATYNAAVAQFCHKNPADAKRQLMTLTSGPQAVNAMLALATIADAGANHAEAIGWYRKVLSVDRTNAAAIAALKQASAAPKAASSSTTQGPR
jgi:tetratricopeptide (TPR) repeat protein